MPETALFAIEFDGLRLLSHQVQAVIDAWTKTIFTVWQGALFQRSPENPDFYLIVVPKRPDLEQYILKLEGMFLAFCAPKHNVRIIAQYDSLVIITEYDAKSGVTQTNITPSERA